MDNFEQEADKPCEVSLIPLEDLRNYDHLGFKLIPLREDSMTPNVPSTNDIYNNLEYWSEDTLRSKHHLFHNVATTFGKSHVKDEDGRDLYLNELDIDSEEVFARLVRAVVKNTEYNIIEEMCKSTYVVKTKKKIGRHIYWFSHKQNEPVRTRDCLFGHEFEIKTDNSNGHSTLPPSCHRLDPSFHYQNMGQNKIAIADDFYDGVLKLLSDCLKKNQSPTSSIVNGSTENESVAYSKIASTIIPAYQKSCRNDIVFYLSALLCKEFNLTLVATEKIVGELCQVTNDDELGSRIAVVRNTYSKAKNGEPINGRTGLFETLERIVGVESASQIIKDISQMLNPHQNSVLAQLDPNIRNELSGHIFETVCYDPISLVVAHAVKKQILTCKIIRYTSLNTRDNHKLENLKYGDVIINAIPTKIIKYEDPTNIETKYEVDFETALGYNIHVGSKTIKDIQEELKLNGLVYKIRTAEEALPAILNAFQRDGKVIVRREVETPGFYLVNGKIVPNKIEVPSTPTREQIISCAEVLSQLSRRTKRVEIFGTFVTWGVVAPFSFVFKQLDEDGHEKWMPWIYACGQTNTGKTTLGRVTLSIYGKHRDKKIHDIGFSSADTIPRFGRVVSYDTYPVLINEVTLTDDRQKQLVEALKHAVQSQTARGRLATRSVAEYISSLSPCILTGNSSPPDDPAFRRRFIYIYLSAGDQHTEEEIKEFNKFLSNNMSILEVLGHFATEYILEHQEIIMNNDWKTIGTTILTEFFKSADLEVPYWVGKFIQDSDVQDVYAEHEQIVRGFFIKKINDTYSRFFNTLSLKDKEMDKTLNLNKLENGLLFCCDKEQLIPYIRANKSGDKIFILPDIMNDFKASKITCVTNFTDLAEMFQTKPEPTYTNNRTVRLISISKQKFLDFLLPSILS
jgi:hypothetical protein